MSAGLVSMIQLNQISSIIVEVKDPLDGVTYFFPI